MLKTIHSCIACCLVSIFFCSCSQAPQPEPTTMVAEAKTRSSRIEPIGAGALMDDHIMFEFAIYYLPTPTKEPLGELDTFLKGKFKGFEKVEKISPPKTGRAIAARVVTNVEESYAPPSFESLRYSGRGLSHEQARAVQGSKAVLLLDFAYSREHVWDGMRAALELTSTLANATGGLLWDEETRQLFTSEEWNKQRVADWTENIPDLSKHTVLHAYPSGEYVRAITLGMAKFGLPDIIIDKFSWSLSRNIGHVINLFGQVIAEGATITKDGEFDLDLGAIQNPKVREPQVNSLKSHATSVALLSLKKGVWEKGDPKNRLIEITFDRYPGPDVHAKQEKMLGSFFGWEDSLIPVKHDEELLEASRRAKGKLPTLRTAFGTGLAPGEYIYVKAPFKTSGGGDEWMWVEVTSWMGDKIKGLLQNEPFNIPNLHSGQIVEISEANVFDYIRRYADGKVEGNETGKIIEKNSGPAKDTEE